MSNSPKKKINTKSLSTSINSNNCIFNTNNTNNKNNINHNEVQGQTHIKNGILKNSDKKINDNLKIKFKHQKAKSLINNSQINLLYLNGNKNKNSPKQVSFKLFDKDNNINKGILKNNGYKNLYNKEKEKKYFSNENYINNNSQSNKKNYKKNNSNAMMINNLKLCKSDKRTKENCHIKFGNLKKPNTHLLSRSNPYKYNKNNLYNNEKNKKICYTEKINKSKNYITFISHMKKNTPININNINNITEQNINHSKKLSQQIYDGYKFFMNSLNYNNNNNRIKEINIINIDLKNLNIKKSTLYVIILVLIKIKLTILKKILIIIIKIIIVLFSLVFINIIKIIKMAISYKIIIKAKLLSYPPHIKI